MKMIISGFSGFVGNELLRRCSIDDTLLVGRKKPKSKVLSERYVSYEDFSADNVLFDKIKFDAFIHLAGRAHVMEESEADPLTAYRKANRDLTIELANRAASLGVKRFIFISSVKVNGQLSANGVPFSVFDDEAFSDSYGQSKYEAEHALWDISNKTGLEVVIIRPTLIYGPGVKANFASLLNAVSTGIPLPFGCMTENRRSLVSVTNLVDLILTCIDHPKAANQTFLVSDDHDVSTSQIVAHMAKALGKHHFQIPVPEWCYRFVGKLFRKQEVVDRLLGSLQVDITHTKNTLNWTPPQTLEAGFQETAQAFLQSKQK